MTPFLVGIPTYNRPDCAALCIESILSGTVIPERILVIDNGQRFSSNHSKVQVIRPSRNLGVAASWNLLHKLARPISLIISNDDVTFAPDTAEKLLTADASFADAEGWSCFRQDHDLWDTVGAYDEHFFPAYYEDADYCYRLKLAGVKCVSPTCLASHSRSSTIHSMTPDEYQQFQLCWRDNRDYYMRKWGGDAGHERFVVPFNGDSPTPQSAAMIRQVEFLRRCLGSSDINEHLPTLAYYAKRVKHVTEVIVRQNNSTAAFLWAEPEKLITYDLDPSHKPASLMSMQNSARFSYLNVDPLHTAVDETDLLFIDSIHTQARLEAELRILAPKVRTWIILHDTQIYGQIGEDGSPGLLSALHALTDTGEFCLHEVFENNNGLTVLRRVTQETL